jgi:hypothetical protein
MYVSEIVMGDQELVTGVFEYATAPSCSNTATAALVRMVA